MAWIGKVGGGVLGFVAGGPVGAVIGAALGHQFDRGIGNVGPGLLDWDRPRATTAADRQALFFETTFLTLGHLAKADGQVSPAEIGAARTIMQEMRLGPEETRRAEALFTAGKRPEFPITRQVTALRESCRGHPEILRTFLELQVDFALDKGHISQAERQVLARVGQTLGVAREDMARLEGVMRARRAFRQGPDRQAGGLGTLEGAYRALGVEPGASDDAVKTAYRRLMNQHHPDKQAARGLPESLREVAEERTREIRAAYELIRERRGFR